MSTTWCHGGQVADAEESDVGTRWDAIVLAGGRSSRLGGVDKAALRAGQRTLLQLTLDAVSSADRVLVVGDRSWAAAGERTVVVLEDPPGGGPAAAIGAGLDGVTAGVTVVLACDMPRVGEVVPVLLEALEGAGASVQSVVARDGDRTQYLAAAHRTSSLRDRSTALAPLAGRSVRQLYADLAVVMVDVPPGSTHDIDTWDDAARAGLTR